MSTSVRWDERAEAFFERNERLCFGLLLAWFVVQAAYFALHVRVGIPADEYHHIAVSGFYSRTSGFRLVDTPETWPFGPLSVHPGLFHWLMGRLLHLKPAAFADTLFLRFVSGSFAVASVVAFWRLSRRILPRAWMRLTAVAIMCTLPMFVFVAGSVTYDSFINLCAFAGMISLVDFLRKGRRRDLLAHALWWGLGSLAKVTMLPLYLSTFLLLGLRYKFGRTPVPGPWNRTDKIFLGLVLVVATLNVHLYGSNLVIHRQLMPGPAAVLPPEAWNKYPAYRRDQALLATLDQRARWPNHVWLKKYTNASLRGMFGVMVHKAYPRSEHDLNFYNAAILSTLAGLGWLFKRRKEFRLPTTVDLVSEPLFACFVTCLVYTSIVCLDNYRTYRTFRVFGMGLQSRYNFPVLSCAVVILAWLAYVPVPRKWGLLAAALVSLIFFWEGFPTMIMQMDPDWFAR